ncbi:hypothetical protein [Acidocella sp.]|uniref:hypothetical protein n=1 Tax=Acidocella sp. TaxID=50710 RepID=UPI003CFE48C4
MTRQQNAAKRLRKANKILEEAKEELKAILIEKSWPDMPGLFSAAGGTGVYIGNSPVLTKRSSAQEEKQEIARWPKKAGGVSGAPPGEGDAWQYAALYLLRYRGKLATQTRGQK